MDPLLHTLNPAQLHAATSPSPILQILAPPGSGKTATLTSRLAYLLSHHNYKSWNIICLTFTIKSAREMNERIAKLLNNGVENKLILGTFHSVCRRYLVSYGHLIGVRKGFGIADSGDTLAILKRIVKRRKGGGVGAGTGLDAQKVRGRISHAKSKGLGWEDLAREQQGGAGRKKGDVEQQEFVAVFEEYERQLAASNLLDYDDLLLRCVDLLRKQPECVSNVEAVLIDEFQDTNVTQFELMTLFARKNGRVTTVGDMDQSIYGWRSAEIKNLKRMREVYPDTLVIHLQENYRSSAAILMAAGEVIEQDDSRPQVCMVPTHCPGTAPVLRRLPSAEVEAAWIVSEVQRTRALTGEILNYSDFAILLRSASLSRLIETALGKTGIPYRMVGGHRFYDRAEIKLLLDYLRVVSQPTNNDAVVRCINTPSRRIGDATVKGLLEEAESKQSSLWDLLLSIVHGSKKVRTKITSAAESGIGAFVGLIRGRKSQMLDTNKACSPEDLLRQIIKKLEIETWLKKTYTEDHETRWLNVEELVAQAADYHVANVEEDAEAVEQVDNDMLPTIDGLKQQKANPSEETLSSFLANVALATELQREDDTEEGTQPQHQVTISTIHAAKGLEWPVVFVPSAYDGCIPHSRAENTDEERRLLYVAMTRAQALLYLSCPMKNSQREEATLSPFLSERKVQHLLSNQGPSIGCGVVNDIARIVGRKCPTQIEVSEACVDLTHFEDNKWPLDGTESMEMKQSRWNRGEELVDYGMSKHQSKRRKVTEDATKQSLDVRASVSVGCTTTMQMQSNFSYNSGFTTASAQMQMSKVAAIEQAKETVELKQRGRPKPDKVVIDQGSLLNLWGVKRPLEEEQPLANKSLDRSYALPRLEKPAQAPLPQPIPQPFASHRLSSKPCSTRPLRVLSESTNTSNGYVFLSSSPPPPEDVPKESFQVNANAKASTSKENAIPSVEYAKVSNALNQTRKTLGMRRSLGGWNAGSRPGFSVPRVNHASR